MAVLAAVLVAACENQRKSSNSESSNRARVTAGASRAAVVAPPAAKASRDRTKGPMGTAHPFVVQASSYAHSWIVACQPRADSNGDGKIAVEFGHHGDPMGDEMFPYLFLTEGPGTVIESLLAVDRSDRFIAYQLPGELRVMDAASGKSLNLSLLGNIDPESFRFGPGNRMAMVRRTSAGSELLLLDVATAEGDAVYDFDGPIAAGEFSDDGKRLTVYEVPKDTDGDGERRIPVANTTRAQGPCVGPAYSWGHYGYSGDELVPREVEIPAPTTVHVPNPDLSTCLKFASGHNGPVHWDSMATGCHPVP